MADTPYQSVNVQYYNADSTIRFGGTLTLPQNKKNSPAVVLLSGTGMQDRDGTMAGHKTFLVIADYLTRNGIAVLRVDDRGVGETTGKYQEATTADFAKDALTSLRWLSKYKGIDSRNVGLIGHSEGGAAAYMAAAESKDVAFIITLAGLATPGLQALKLQNETIVNTAPISDQKKYRFNSINKFMFDTVYAHADSPDLEVHMRAAYREWQIKDSLYMVANPQDSADKGRFFFPMESYVMNATGPWYRYHIRFDPAPFLKKVDVPFLAINGDKDIMVNADANLNYIKQHTTANKNVTTIKAPGLNHLFQHCKECTNSEPFQLKEDFAPEILKMMTTWIKENTGMR
ncbi:alpha/beta hydrolase family protein [Chitinophaga rhizophila]|uniref:Alpha/beta hydrolase n=1 Tax=Chitinophaga rhizophila TaxID=2866212 RepID=A0ABS7GCB2_9BACT|nr:alpha/beta hydrolase [Chitinophaga rhizophila]MBW8684785.1 alpha/beta hydrolase [Chitinophaga rhizophila]